MFYRLFQYQNGTLHELLTSKYIRIPIFRVRISGFQSFSSFYLLSFFKVTKDSSRVVESVSETYAW